MSDTFRASLKQTPARMIPVSPFEGVSEKALEAVVDSTHGLNAALRELGDVRREAQQHERDLEKVPAAELTPTDKFTQQMYGSMRGLIAISDVSQELTRFTVKMGICQSCGKNLQSFLRGGQ
ncbi:conserved hypothetical protein [Roseibium sp. TrichSKD4]|uniref:hypothetical protein n=1 Tax=Roseibium sp. TrichSKD4 TaxID=744980 RepID=UPI0001E56A89|nr:hypothetical protein [Roseibium sp. TrichSKD4]EFO31925.1 conserved hypothetical protein [Roseibium sp. TrichSKD4]